MHSDTTIRRNPRAVFRKLSDGTAVLLHVDSTAYHGVNEMGVLIWDVLETPRTFDELLVELRASLTASPPELADDVQEFVRNLEARDLVSIAGRT